MRTTPAKNAWSLSGAGKYFLLVSTGTFLCLSSRLAADSLDSDSDSKDGAAILMRIRTDIRKNQEALRAVDLTYEIDTTFPGIEEYEVRTHKTGKAGRNIVLEYQTGPRFTTRLRSVAGTKGIRRERLTQGGELPVGSAIEVFTNDRTVSYFPAQNYAVVNSGNTLQTKPPEAVLFDGMHDSLLSFIECEGLSLETIENLENAQLIRVSAPVPDSRTLRHTLLLDPSLNYSPVSVELSSNGELLSQVSNLEYQLLPNGAYVLRALEHEQIRRIDPLAKAASPPSVAQKSMRLTNVAITEPSDELFEIHMPAGTEIRDSILKRVSRLESHVSSLKYEADTLIDESKGLNPAPDLHAATTVTTRPDGIPISSPPSLAHEQARSSDHTKKWTLTGTVLAIILVGAWLWIVQRRRVAAELK